jgi:very-short-patch-repair endonuclease
VVWTYREARRHASRRELRDAVASGALVHARHDRYVAATEDDLVLRAVRAGTAVSCVSALARHGVWVLDHGVHLRRAAGGRSCRVLADRVHVIGTTNPHGFDGVDIALGVAMSCLPFEEAVAAVDSVLDHGLLTRAEVERLGTRAALRRVIAASDGRAQSGLESLVRVRLRSRRVTVTPQVPIRDVGSVDLVVGDRLVIELDGDRWHSTPAQRENDRRRDATLVERGYVVLRYGFQRVVHDWPETERQILSLVRSNRHRWPRRACTTSEESTS